MWSMPTLLASIAAWIAMRMSLGIGFTRDQPTWAYNSGCYSLVALMSVSVLAFLLSHPRSVPVRVLSFPALVWMGRISYGLYLYQMPLKSVLMNHLGWSDREMFVLDAPLVVLISWLSFTLIEQPLIQWGRRLAKASAITVAHPAATP